MKVKLALAILGVLVICSLSGCQEVYQPSYDMLKADLAEAQAKIAEREAKIAEREAKIAELQAELEAEQDRVTELQTQLEAYQAKTAHLQTELAICQAAIAKTEETPPPPKPPPLQEEDFSYKGFEDETSSIRVAMLNATWQDNRATVSWEVTNTCKRKIFLNLLSVKARDQMWQEGAFVGQRVQFKEWGERGFKDVEDPVSLAPTLLKQQKLWPGQTVQFDTTWTFGPLSKDITINFIAVYSVFKEDEEPIKLERSPERPETSPSLIATRPRD